MKQAIFYRGEADANTDKLHVLVVTNHREVQKAFSASSVWIDRQVAALRNLGLNVSTFDVGVSHSPIYLIKKWLELRRTVRSLNPDVVHARYGTIVAVLSVLAGRPSVITFCGSDLNPGAPVPAIRKSLGFLFSNVAALRARGLICVSPGLRRALWWRREGAVVIPDGVNLDLFSPGAQDRARMELGWNHQRPVVLISIGDDPKKKGLELAKAAMQIAQSRIPEAELYVISNVEPNYMPLYYRAADVLLCASRYEGSPNVVKEALACNLPVVSTPVGDVPERLAGVHPSALVPWDPKLMGEALAKILLTAKRSNGRAHVAHLDLSHTAQQVVSIYRSVLASD